MSMPVARLSAAPKNVPIPGMVHFGCGARFVAFSGHAGAAVHPATKCCGGCNALARRLILAEEALGPY
jgi:hypothetical protein